jgi:hypothetical protein
MSDIQQRIADILTDKSVGVYQDYDLYSISEFGARELAEVLVSELGLKVERLALGVAGWTDQPINGICYAARQSRYVSDWTPDG